MIWLVLGALATWFFYQSRGANASASSPATADFVPTFEPSPGFTMPLDFAPTVGSAPRPANLPLDFSRMDVGAPLAFGAIGGASGGRLGVQQGAGDALRAVNEAQTYVGKTYGTGRACANFVTCIFRDAGWTPPAVNTDWVPNWPALGQSVDRGHLQPGDAIIFDRTYNDPTGSDMTHIGIYAGGGEFVHRAGDGLVKKASIWEPFWEDRFNTGVRVW